MLAAMGVAGPMVTGLAEDFLPHDSPEGLMRRHAGWLARLWRLSPLTLLLHRSNAQVDHLLGGGLLRLTARRSIDRDWQRTRSRPPVVAVPHEADPSQAQRTPELVLQVDVTRSRDPASSLRRRMRALLQPAAAAQLSPLPSLCQLAHALHRQGGVRLLIVVRQLDALLAPRNDDATPRQAWCDALVELLASGPPSVHLLLVVDERADVLLDGLRRRLPQWDDHRLRVGEGSTPIEPAARPSASSSAHDFQRSLDAMLLRVAQFHDLAPKAAPMALPAPAPAPLPVPVPAPVPAALPTQASVAPVPGPTADEAERPPSVTHVPPPATQPLHLARRGLASVLYAAAVLSVCGLVVGGLFWQTRDSAAPAVVQSQPARPAAPAPSTAPAPETVAAETVAAARPSPALAPLRSAGEELAQSLASTGLPLVDARGDTAWASAVRALAARPGLAVLRYDSLQAVRAWPDSPALQVLAPLYTEPVYFAVRADSPWRSLHEIGKARMGLGPADSARALAVGRVWQRLFGQPLPQAQADTTPLADALARLRRAQVDVVAWVGPLPDGASIDAAAGLRLLSLDRSHASTARVQQAFLLTPQPASGAGAVGLSLMSFLVAGPAMPAQTQREVARSLCAALPGLRAHGQPAWRAVQPVPALPTGWPAATAAVEEFNRCALAALPADTRVSSRSSIDRSAT